MTRTQQATMKTNVAAVMAKPAKYPAGFVPTTFQVEADKGAAENRASWSRGIRQHVYGAKPTAPELFLCDNGACYCSNHLGSTAKATGYDISGQAIMAVTASMKAEAKRDGYSIECEECR